MSMDVKIIYSKRKTLCIQITRNAEVIVRAPLRCSKSRIEDFVNSHEKWIKEKLEQVKERLEKKPVYTKEQIEEMRKRAKLISPPRVE